jgi:hypothetical protein
MTVFRGAPEMCTIRERHQIPQFSNCHGSEPPYVRDYIPKEADNPIDCSSAANRALLSTPLDVASPGNKQCCPEVLLPDVGTLGESVMKEYVRQQLSMRLRRVAMAIVAGGLASSAVHANPSNNIVLVPPTQLPALARQSGEALFLHETIDGRTLLYVEQSQGTRLAAFDVTDPIHIKGEGSVQLDAPGPFDFVSPLGDHAELVRFRRDHQDAVLDLPRVKAPNLRSGPTWQGSSASLGNDELAATHRGSEALRAPDYRMVEAGYSQELNRVLDAKRVRGKVTNADMGTTFILTEDGLYVIRRPAVESLHRMMMISPN